MKITRYGITLERIKKEHCEMIRLWRNDRKISQNMFYHKTITYEMQHQWFERIDNNEHFFFLILYQQKAVGLINISSIDWSNRSAFSGLFIYEDSCIGTDVPVRASLAMLDVFFLLGGIEKVCAKVRGDNKIAHRYNTQLGFQKKGAIESGQGFEYELNLLDYLNATKQLRIFAAKENDATILEFENTLLDEALKNLFLKSASKTTLENLKVEIK